MSQAETTWYIVKQPDGKCAILPSNQLTDEQGNLSLPTSTEHWGPFAAPPEAIARRVGLIRAGKCQPS